MEHYFGTLHHIVEVRDVVADSVDDDQIRQILVEHQGQREFHQGTVGHDVLSAKADQPELVVGQLPSAHQFEALQYLQRVQVLSRQHGSGYHAARGSLAALFATGYGNHVAARKTADAAVIQQVAVVVKAVVPMHLPGIELLHQCQILFLFVGQQALRGFGYYAFSPLTFQRIGQKVHVGVVHLI